MTTPTELQRDILGIVRDIEGNLQPAAAQMGLTTVDQALGQAVLALNEAADHVDAFRKSMKDGVMKRFREGGQR